MDSTSETPGMTSLPPTTPNGPSNAYLPTAVDLHRKLTRVLH